MRDAGCAKTAAEIFIILTIRNLSEVDEITPAISEQGAMLKSKLMPSLFGNVVIG